MQQRRRPLPLHSRVIQAIERKRAKIKITSAKRESERSKEIEREKDKERESAKIL